MIFEYGEAEISHLKRRDKRLGEVIDRIGKIRRGTDPDLFSSVVHHIVGQQISTAAQATVWARMTALLGAVTAETVRTAGLEELQSCGITFKKAAYIKEFAAKVACGDFDVDALRTQSDAEVVARLSALRGVGVWTAEMLMTFCLQRPDVVSFGDLAIQRGMRMLYHHRRIDRVRFERYRHRYSPYGTVAGLYLWAVAGGAVPELKDPAPKKQGAKR